MIYQELALAPHLSVEANVMLGQERTRAGLISAGTPQARRRRASSVGTSGYPARSDRRQPGCRRTATRGGGPGARLQCRVIVFDEPTSSLSEHDAVRLFAIVERLRARGLGIIYISHFLEEARRVAQTFTVLRDGKNVAAGQLAETDLRSIIGFMVGRNLDELFPRVPHTPGEPILEIDRLRVRKSGKAVSLELRSGEILGVAGLIGAGRTTLVRSIFGLAPVVGGRIKVHSFTGGYASPKTRIDQGMGFASEDRKAEGLALSRSIEDNLTYSALRRHARWGWLKLNRRRAQVVLWMERLRIAATGPGQTTGNLSGGNQQKVALARLLHQQADVLLLDEPTRGIDVGSKAEIYRLIGEQAAGGKAILVVSSYLPELLGICDRIAVMARGDLSAARPVSAWTEHEIMHVATQTEGAQPAVTMDRDLP